MADQLSLREDFDAVCEQVERNKRRKGSVGGDSSLSRDDGFGPSLLQNKL